MPAARHFSRVPPMALAVSAMMGRRSPRRSFKSRLRISAVVSKPSMPGMLQSMSTKSKPRFSSDSRAWLPLETTSHSKPSEPTMARATFWFMALSSAMRMRWHGAPGIGKVTSAADGRTSPITVSMASFKRRRRMGLVTMTVYASRKRSENSAAS